jgi:hypothetical protein
MDYKDTTEHTADKDHGRLTSSVKSQDRGSSEDGKVQHEPHDYYDPDVRASPSMRSKFIPEPTPKVVHSPILKNKALIKGERSSDPQLSKEIFEKRIKRIMPAYNEGKLVKSSRQTQSSILMQENDSETGSISKPKKGGIKASFSDIVMLASFQKKEEEVNNDDDSDKLDSITQSIDMATNPKRGSAQIYNTESAVRPMPARRASFGNSSKGSLSSDVHANAKELDESFMIKIRGLKFTLLAILSNTFLLFLLISLKSSHGLVLSVSGFLMHIGPVVMQTWMHVCHYFTERGLTEASGIFIGYLMSRKEGYSVAACAFVHTSTFEKFSFVGFLSFKSKCKNLLQKFVYLWFFQVAILLITVLSSTSITHQDMRVDAGLSKCSVYKQEDIPFDRGIPTKDGAIGVAEYVFGMSIGRLRSQEDVSFTTHIFPPQLVDTAYDGSSIVGPGFTTKVDTSCDCSNSLNAVHLVASGVDATYVSDMVHQVRRLGDLTGIVSSLEYNQTAETVTVVSLLVNVGVCGGRNATNPGIPVCTTVLSEHNNAVVLARYITDGTPASVAIAYVENRETLGKADIEWMYKALDNFLGGKINTFVLPETIPGLVNPMLWWATPNMIKVSPSLLEAGMETTMAMIMRPAIQRTYSTQGEMCTQNVIDDTKSVFFISGFGFTFGLIFCITEIVINLICIGMAVPWFLKKNPIGPAIRLASDKNYFMIMLASRLGAQTINGTSLTGTITTIWPKMDIFLRVGESIGTKDDVEFGMITIDRPKMVTDFVSSKSYS